MRTIFLAVVAFVVALLGIEVYRAKKAGKSVTGQAKDDWNKIKTKAFSSLNKVTKKTDEVKKEAPVDKNACPACGCQNVPVNTECPNCKTFRVE